jgi:hydroxyacylglutathione hydrolase
MVSATGAKIIAHKDAGRRIPNVGRGVGLGDIVKVGNTVELECLDTPGHTMSHICLLSRTNPPALFSGDTLFNAGAGNCHNGGHPAALYETFSTCLEQLSDETLLYPGHDYLINNLRYTLDREPDNTAAREMLDKYSEQNPNDAHITTLREEREINVFFRLRSPTIVRRLAQAFPEIGSDSDERTVFLKLRELRNSW